MNFVNIFVTIVIIFAGFFGILGGLFIGKIIEKKNNQKIQKNLVEVAEGKRENSLTIEGIKYHAAKFRLRDDDGNETLIDLQGGKIKQDGKENNNKERNIEEDNSTSDIRKDSKGTRVHSTTRKDKKRSTRSGRSRRFG